jgi:hypothetical protein
LIDFYHRFVNVLDENVQQQGRGLGMRETKSQCYQGLCFIDTFDWFLLCSVLFMRTVMVKDYLPLDFALSCACFEVGTPSRIYSLTVSPL